MTSEQVDKNAEFLKAYDDFADAIFRHCYFRIFDREKAKDVVQDTFVRLWKYIAGGEDIKNTKALLYKMANNLMIDDSRKKSTVSIELLAEKGFDPGDDHMPKLINELDSRYVTGVLNQLEPKYRDVIAMRYISDLSIGEIAEVTNESENNVSVRIHRGLKQLKEIINDR